MGKYHQIDVYIYPINDMVGGSVGSLFCGVVLGVLTKSVLLCQPRVTVTSCFVYNCYVKNSV